MFTETFKRNTLQGLEKKKNLGWISFIEMRLKRKVWVQRAFVFNNEFLLSNDKL